MGSKLICTECSCSFGSGQSLFYHFKKEHKYSGDEAYATVGEIIDSCKNLKLTCEECGQKFTSGEGLFYHYINVHDLDNDEAYQIVGEAMAPI